MAWLGPCRKRCSANGCIAAPAAPAVATAAAKCPGSRRRRGRRLCRARGGSFRPASRPVTRLHSGASSPPEPRQPHDAAQALSAHVIPGDGCGGVWKAGHTLCLISRSKRWHSGAPPDDAAQAFSAHVIPGAVPGARVWEAGHTLRFASWSKRGQSVVPRLTLLWRHSLPSCHPS